MIWCLRYLNIDAIDLGLIHCLFVTRIYCMMFLKVLICIAVRLDNDPNLVAERLQTNMMVAAFGEHWQQLYRPVAVCNMKTTTVMGLKKDLSLTMKGLAEAGIVSANAELVDVWCIKRGPSDGDAARPASGFPTAFSNLPAAKPSAPAAFHCLAFWDTHSVPDEAVLQSTVTIGHNYEEEDFKVQLLREV